MIKAVIQQAKSSDQLFERTGVEEEQLLFSIDKLGLDKDPEFIRLMSEAMMKAKMKASQAMGMAGGGGMGMGGQMQGMF